MTTTVVTEEAVAPTEERAVEASAETAEAVADAAVEVAEVQEAASVERSEINAEVEKERIEADKEVAVAAIEAASVNDVHAEGLNECRTNIATLSASQTQMREQIALILQRLPEQPPPTQLPQEGAGEVTPDNQEAPEAPAKKKRRLRLI